eukprot:15339900-Alexandrium_andersonii.AAC.1
MWLAALVWGLIFKVVFKVLLVVATAALSGAAVVVPMAGPVLLLAGAGRAGRVAWRVCMWMTRPSGAEGHAGGEATQYQFEEMGK